MCSDASPPPSRLDLSPVQILREFKGKDALHVDWVGAFNNMLKAMAAYAKRVHTQGLTWGK